MEAKPLAIIPIQAEPQRMGDKISGQCEIDSIAVSSFDELGSDLWGSPRVVDYRPVAAKISTPTTPQSEKAGSLGKREKTIHTLGAAGSPVKKIKNEITIDSIWKNLEVYTLESCPEAAPHPTHQRKSKVYHNGDTFTGQFKNLKKNGHGEYTWTNGNKYTGSYKNGQKHGPGEYRWANGDRYTGEFQDN